jgi:hypothetical protein
VPPEGAARGVAAIFGEIFRRLAEQKEGRIEKGHPLPDPAHSLIATPRSAWCHK